MYAKLENNKLISAPYYLILNNKTILNPQKDDYLCAGYKEVQYSIKPEPEEGCEIITSYSEYDDKIVVNYQLQNILQTAEQRQEEFYNNFIPTSWRNFTKQTQGYQSAVEAVNCVFNMVNILGSFTSDLAPLLIFYQTPDFNDETQCSEEWLVENQYIHQPCIKEEFLLWYKEFQIVWAQTEHTSTTISV